MAVLRWGIIGCGDVCERKSGPPLRDVEDSELVAVMRRNADLAEDFAKRHHVPKFYSDVDALLADPDINAVYVATPGSNHESFAVAAANAGKHVLCEKPMAPDAAACTRIIEACKANGVELAVAYYRRGYPTILKTKELIDSGELGTISRLRIGYAFPLSHRIDLVHFLLGEVDTVKLTHGTSDSYTPPEPGTLVHCYTKGGAEAIMSVGWHEPIGAETLEIVGDKATALITDLKAGGMETHRDGKVTPIPQPGLPWTHWGLVDNFVRYMKGEAPLACDGVEGRKSTVILDVAGGMCEVGGDPVRVDYDSDEPIADKRPDFN